MKFRYINLLSTLMLVSAGSAFGAEVGQVIDIQPVIEERANIGKVRSVHHHQPNIDGIDYRGFGPPVQHLSVFQLLALPNKFEGDNIEFHGYFCIGQEKCEGPRTIRLFATREALRHRIRKESVSIFLKADFQGLERFQNGDAISATGVFHENQKDTSFFGDSGRIDEASICLDRWF